MKGLKIISLFICTGFLFAASATEVVLQNGLNGYNGCIDSYCRSQSYTTNYGTATDLRTKYEMCSS